MATHRSDRIRWCPECKRAYSVPAARTMPVRCPECEQQAATENSPPPVRSDRPLRHRSSGGLRLVVGWLGVALLLGVLVAGAVAYFVRAVDPATGITFDGFGRELSVAPLLVRLILGQQYLWAGWLWCFVDAAIFWGGIVAGIGLAGWGFSASATPDEEQP